MAEDLSLTEIFAWLRKRDTSALPEITQAMILKAWHAGRLPLVADKVREFRCACSARPHVYVPEPHPGDLQAKQYVEELRKTKIVRYLPASAQPATIVTEELLSDQPIPTYIPDTDIKFYWTARTAIWRDPATSFVAEFSGIRTTREAYCREWPPLAAKTPKEWAFAKVGLLLGSDIQSGIGRHKLAEVLTPLMENDYKHGLVTRALRESTIYRSLEEWGVWQHGALAREIVVRNDQ